MLARTISPLKTSYFITFSYIIKVLNHFTTEILDLSGRGVQELMLGLSSHHSNDLTLPHVSMSVR